jgi:hypothetical protein
VTRSRRGPEGSRRRLAPICLAAALLASLVCVPGLAAAAEAPSFCRERFVRDYEAPLREMPHLRPPPQGELPFGPRNFGIHRIDRTPLVLQGSRFGYRFGGKNEGSRVLDLRWRATAVARLVSREGRVRRVVGKRRWRVERVKDLEKLELAFPAEHAGFYRVDLRLATLGGRRHVAYRDYFRVLKRSNDVLIELSGDSVHRGEPVWGALEYPGAGNLTSRGYLEVEREEEGTWVPVPRPPSARSVAGWNWLLSSGEIGYCDRFDVPPDAAPGTYRFSTAVNLANTQKKVRVTAPFAVVP